MMRFGLFLALLALASCVEGTNDCQRAVERTVNESAADFAIMVLATGKMLPYDAGKFHVCEALKLRTPTKFFMVTLQAQVGNLSVPGELGICLPAECRDEDFINGAEFVNKIIQNMTGQHNTGFFVPKYQLSQAGSADTQLWLSQQPNWKQPPHTVSHLNPTNVDDDLKPWGTGATVTCCVVLALLMWTVFSTGIAMMARQSPQQGQLEAGPPRSTSQKLSSLALVEAWSLIGPKGTWTTLWKCPPRRPTDCLNGIRVISMFCIVMAHSFMVSQNNAGYSNAEDIKKTPLTPDAAETTWQIPLIFGAGDMSVDTFFFISGFLLSFIAKARHSPVFMGTVLRYFRIVPSMAFMVLIYGWLAPYLMYGPFAARAQQSILRKCTKNWWANVLFIMNWTPGTLHGPFDPAELCAGWTWYLGNDFIFAIIGLILVNLWRGRQKLAWTSIVLFLGASFAFSMAITWEHGMGVYSLGQGRVYTYFLYSNPLHRIPVFLVGLILPWVYHSLDRRGIVQDQNAPKSEKARLLWICASVVSLGVLLACIFLPMTDFPGGSGSSRESKNWSQIACSLFMTFGRPLWGVAFAVITSACYYGYLPLVDGALSHWAWHPLVKLTYGTYLLHIVVIKVLAANMAGYYYYSMSEVLLRAFGHCTLAYAASVVMWCLVERPFATLVDAAMPKRQPKGAQGKDQTPPQGAPLSENERSGDAVTKATPMLGPCDKV